MCKRYAIKSCKKSLIISIISEEGERLTSLSIWNVSSWIIYVVKKRFSNMQTMSWLIIISRLFQASNVFLRIDSQSVIRCGVLSKFEKRHRLQLWGRYKYFSLLFSTIVVNCFERQSSALTCFSLFQSGINQSRILRI